MKSLLTQCIDEVAQTAPRREAFVLGNQYITYGELSEKSDQLAHFLIKDGVKKGDRVGIYMRRALDSVIAVYGILKAGAAYVPIDPFAPLSAVERSIKHCRINHLVSHQALHREIFALIERSKVTIQAVIGLNPSSATRPYYSWDDIFRENINHTPDVSLKSEDLAYIMYTSGSTGTPKGIMHTHSSGLSYARLSAGQYGIGPCDRVGSHSPLHFDMSTLGFFSAPYAGATTVLIPEAHTKLPASLAQLMEQSRISIWYSVPYALRQLLYHGSIEKRDFSSLRWILYGGEPMSRRQIYALMQAWPQARFANVYGPAEVNQCTHFEIERPSGPVREEEYNSPIPLGSIWEETEGIIVNEMDQPVLEGTAGELAIHSPTMMQGYWDQPELNKQVFFNRELKGEKLKFYKTGDLVRVDEQGSLQFLGRKDRQIKVRGYRVELDEIESLLACHQSIEEAAVFAVRNSEEHLSIEAVIRPREKATQLHLDVLDYLRAQLPPYSIPTKVTLTDSFPRTATGKIDRRRLQKLAESKPMEKELEVVQEPECKPRAMQNSVRATESH